MNFLPTFIFISTILFGFLFVIWSRGRWVNTLLKIVFFAMFVYGAFITLNLAGFLIKA